MTQNNPDYTTHPTHVRIFEDAGEWFLDGADDELNYTEACWSFDSFKGAVEAVEEFVASVAATPRHEWRWNVQRTGMARHLSAASFAIKNGEVSGA